MSEPLHFLIVDDSPDSRFLLMRALTKSFPDAVLQEFTAAEPALERGSDPEIAAIIVHRTREMTGAYFVQALRKVNSRVPIVMISSIDRSHGAMAAGANRFVLFDDWKDIGAIVGELVTAQMREAPTL